MGSNPSFGTSLDGPAPGAVGFSDGLPGPIGSGMIAGEMETPRSRSSFGRAGLALAIIAGILLLGDLNSRMSDARRLERDARSLQTEVAGMEALAARLATQVAQATSESLVEEWARREGKMVREGEHLIVPLAPSGTVGASAANATPLAPLPSRWEVWWALLTGG